MSDRSLGKLRAWRPLAVMGVISLLVAACGGTSGNQNQGTQLASDQTLRFPILDDFGTLDPGQADAETDQEIQQNIFDNLYRFDMNLNIQPDLAESQPQVSSDGLTYTFKLRKDVTFSNGDKFTSKDVLYSWNRAAAMQGAYATVFSGVAGYSKVAKNTVTGAALQALLEKNDPSVTLSGLSAPDDNTVQVKLSAPAGWFVSAITLSGATGAIVDQKTVKQDFDNWWTKPDLAVGTGPFKMTARTPGQSVDFEAVSNWWGSPKPTLKKVHLEVIKSPTSAIAKYEQGGFDIYGYGGYSNAPVSEIRRIQGTSNEKSQLLLHPKVRSYWVSFNMVSDAKRPAKGPFVDNNCPCPSGAAHDLRLAFALAIDKQKMAQIVCQNIVCQPITGGLIVKGLKGYLGDNQDPLAKFDAARAKQLLTSADPTNSKTKGLVYVYDPENPINAAVASNLQDQWQTNLGVHVDIQPQSHSQFIKNRLKGGYVLSRDGWQADYDHPQDWYDNLWGSIVGCPDAGCSTGYVTKEYDDLLAKADAEALPGALADYKKLGEILERDVVYIPLFATTGAFLFKPYVQGASTNNFFDTYWNQIKIGQH
jgi:oligopeptide transport system substrate-binding protein